MQFSLNLYILKILCSVFPISFVSNGHTLMKLFCIYFGKTHYKPISKSVRNSTILEETLILGWSENKLMKKAQRTELFFIKVLISS